MLHNFFFLQPLGKNSFITVNLLKNIMLELGGTVNLGISLEKT